MEHLVKNWQIFEHDSFPQNRAKKLTKKYKKEVINLFKNLQTYLNSLQADLNPEELKRSHSFVHEEKKGLYAIDARPPVKGIQLRLYIYPQLIKKELHIMIIGNKKTQSMDIKIAHSEIKKEENLDKKD